MLVDQILIEAENYFSSYPRGLVYSQFKNCSVLFSKDSYGEYRDASRR